MSCLENYTALTDSFVRQCRDILGADLVGVYLHGSAAMGCFNGRKSDIDLIIVVRGEISDGRKRRLMDMTVALNGQAPAKGIEMSVVRREVCDPFVYPTPFELHFSIAHLEWYRSDPESYIEKMNGTDIDLAAHFTVINHRGITLWGEDISDVFSSVPQEHYLDSIRSDVANAVEDISGDPVYIILNLCRVLAFRRDGLVLSKQEGGEWGMDALPEEFRGLISAALTEYGGGEAMAPDSGEAERCARYMLGQIG